MTDLLAGMPQQVAVYLDMDNIVISRYDELHGRDSFRDDRANSRNPSPLIKQRLAEARIDLNAIIDYASAFGTVVISRAYANWATPVNASYASDTLRRSIDLVEDLSRFAGITHVLVAAGDSDYVALAQRCKRLGRRVIGVGVAKSVGRYWESACDEFRFYGQLPGLLPPSEIIALGDGLPSSAPDPAAQEADGEALQRALPLLAARNDYSWFTAAALKVQIKRLDPSFDESSLGHRNFTSYLRAFPSLVEVRTTDSGTEVRYRGAAEQAVEQSAPPVAEPALSALHSAPRESIPAGVLELRRQLGLATSAPLAVAGEALWIRATRELWSIVEAAEPQQALPTDAVLERLLRSGTESMTARRTTHQVLMAGFPVLVRNTEMNWRPNPELVPLSDEQLLRLFRQWTAERARNRNYPNPVSPEQLAAALYPMPAPEEALDAFRQVEAWAGYEQMRRALEPVLLPPLVLWDVAQAMCELSDTMPLPSVEAFTVAMSGPLAELERDPASVPMTAAYTSLRDAGVIAEDRRNSASCPELESVIDAVLRSWADRLRAGDLLAAEEMVCREAFYRLALPDRYQEAQRVWVRELLTHSTGP
jgi:OST-HTH/LOTUS domain/NYN domain